LAEVEAIRARTIALPRPIGRIRGRLVESADAVHLPRSWPSLRDVELQVDSRVPALEPLLSLAARSPRLKGILARLEGPGLALARRLGSSTGCYAIEGEGRSGETARLALISRSAHQPTPLAPAVLAARAIAEGRFEPRGLVPPHLHADPAAILEWLERRGVERVRF